MNRNIILATLTFVASLFINLKSLSAQVQTYSYTGPGFSLAECQAAGGGTACVGSGSIKASVTLSGVPQNYTGTVLASSVSSYMISAAGFGSFSNRGDLDTTAFYLQDGLISGWQLFATNFPGVYNAIGMGTANGTGGYDTASRFIGYTGSVDALGYTSIPPEGIWTNPKSFGISCGKPGAASCGEPIDLGSGNMFSEVEDYHTVGQNSFSFKRFYNSMANPDTFAVAMGLNWRHNYDRYLHILNPSAIYGVMVERPDGQVISFSSNSGTYIPDSDIDMRLTNPSGSTWKLIDGDDTVETYTASGDKGALNSITLRNGYTQAISYSSGQISFVSDSYSRQLGFTYSSAGLLTNVTTPDAQTLSYSYVNFSSTNQNLLTSVTYP